MRVCVEYRSQRVSAGVTVNREGIRLISTGLGDSLRAENEKGRGGQAGREQVLEILSRFQHTLVAYS